MATLITVHGTYDNHEDDAGERWWQAGSTFDTRMRDLVAGEDTSALKIERLHWDGKTLLLPVNVPLPISFNALIRLKKRPSPIASLGIVTAVQ